MNIDSLIEKPLKFKQVPYTEPKTNKKGRRRSSTRTGPKLFKCTGYGDCNMVFTRSEHLARHERKHTGEKPFTCVVPGCDRTFSRFDNMMQHTQTHSHQKTRTNKRPLAVNAELKRVSQLRRASMPVDQYKPIDIRPAPLSPRNRMSWPQTYAMQPSGPPNYGHPVLPSPYSTQHPNEPQFGHHSNTISFHYPSYHQPYLEPMEPSPQRELSINTSFKRNSIRRLSMADLHSPIDNIHPERPMEASPSPISEPQSPPTPPRHGPEAQKGVEITEDEYQALQGFGKFHLREVRKMDIDFTAPNIETIRSNISVNESCERGR
ncbi:hypothetical protein BC943DRAFT_323750 [Umbelopsis sp. AD052]|nr:hypothetical protein BC943DRAFT_323750 [Umbelopsis sp. AD052]